MSKFYFIFLSKPAQHRLSPTSQTLGGQDSHPWWPRFLFYKYNQSDSTEKEPKTHNIFSRTTKAATINLQNNQRKHKKHTSNHNTISKPVISQITTQSQNQHSRDKSPRTQPFRTHKHNT